jgi:hypothetical protein
MLRRTRLAVALTLAMTLGFAACSRTLTPGGDVPAGSPRATTSPALGHAAVAPDTVIDGYLVGLPDPACERIDQPECARILELAKTHSINTARGRESIADCSLNKAECDRFTGVPARPGFSKQTGLAEIVGLAEDAVLSGWPDLDPADIVGFGLYAQSQTGWKDANGTYVRSQSGPHTLVVFDFAGGVRHVAGIVCGIGECWAYGPADLTAPPPADVVSSAGRAPLPSPR